MLFSLLSRHPGTARPAIAGTLTMAAAVGVAVALPARAAPPAPVRVTSSRLAATFGTDGSVQSLRVVGDLFPTEYVMNPTTAPEQAAEKNAALRQWLGNVMFSYAPGTGAVTTKGVGGRPWRQAWTTASADGRRVTRVGGAVDVRYTGSKNARGIKDFRFDQRFTAQPDGSLLWRQTVTNTSGGPLTIGDWGVPVPANELWTAPSDKIYETRVLTRSSVTGDGSYLQLGRPSGLGPSVLMVPDPATGTRWEYQDRWRTEEVGTTPWAWNQDAQTSNLKGLNVFYLHSAAIARTGRGRLPSTSLRLAAGASRTYAIRITTTASESTVAQALYDAGVPDIAVVPGMVVPYDQLARVAVRVRGTVTGVTARAGNDLRRAAPVPPAVTADGAANGYRRYRLRFTRAHLGENTLTVRWSDLAGHPRATVLRFRVVDKAADLMARHAAFMVKHQQWTAKDGIARTDVRYATFDDWLMNAAGGGLPTAKRPPRGRMNRYQGAWGLGDDWGLTHAQFLAAQQVVSPDRQQVAALDEYLEHAVWRNLMGNGPGTRRTSYLVPNWWDAQHPGLANAGPTGRGYAYPHVYNTFFAMYLVASQNPGLVRYSHPARWYLETAYRILVELYDGPVYYSWGTGLMGEQTTPQLIDALRAEGLVQQADDVVDRMLRKQATFARNPYPYGSEYAYDNTGEESVYTLARLRAQLDPANAPAAIAAMRKIVTKTRAVRGRNPVWFQYANPVGNTSENWWQFQYTIALAGTTMDDYLMHVAPVATGANTLTTTERAELARLNYGAKLGGLSLVNSGEISNHPANIGASAWTYQAELGRLGTNGWGGGPKAALLNGFRGMTGESDLTLWGILQYLSADVVTDDPVFGTVGYGARVTRTATGLDVVPTDGLSRRLNLVSQGLSVALTSDRYTAATVPADNRGLRLTMTNTTGRRHPTTLQVSGLATGSYAVLVDGRRQRTVNVTAGTKAVVTPRLQVPVSLPAAGARVELVPVPVGSNSAPRVTVQSAGPAPILGVDPVSLHATVTDDGLGAPNGRLDTRWTRVSGPADGIAAFTDAGATHTQATVNRPGRYTFRFTATDGSRSTSRDVTVRIAAPPSPQSPAGRWTFDSATAGRSPDTARHLGPVFLDGPATVTRTTADGGFLRLGDSNASWAQLPPGVLARPGAVTVSAWVRLPKAATVEAPVLSVARSSNRYLTLLAADPELDGAPSVWVGDPSLDGVITTIDAAKPLTPGRWTHLRLTIEPRTTPGTSVGRLYVDGTFVGTETLPMTPADLGRTTRNLLGRLPTGASRLVGDLDDVRIDDGVVDTWTSAPRR